MTVASWSAGSTRSPAPFPGNCFVRSRNVSVVAGGEALPFRILVKEGNWFYEPNRDQHTDVFVLKALLWWKVVPELHHEQAVRNEWTKHVLDKLWTALKEKEELPWPSPVLESIDPSKYTDMTLGRYVMDLVAGLTDDELGAFYEVLSEPGRDNADAIKLAKTASFPVPPDVERRAISR